MNPRIAILLTVALTLTSCVRMSPEEESVITKARTIKKFPVERHELVQTLELNPISGRRFGGGIRNGYIILEESWEHTSGLTVSAFDAEYVGAIETTSEFVDGIIDGTGKFPKTSRLINSPRNKFNGFVISRGDSEIYNSRER